MSVFVILGRGSTNPPGLTDAIESSYEGRSFRYADNIWFVIADQSARQISDQLNLKRGGIGRALVMRLTGDYGGMSQPEIWDWLRTAFEKQDG
jgi:hypothetical protein